MVAAAVLGTTRRPLFGSAQERRGGTAFARLPVPRLRALAAELGQTPAAKEQLDYWRTQLDGVTTLPLRTDRPRPEVWSGHGARHYLEFSRTLSADLRALSQNQGVTPFMTLLAVFQCLLFRHTGHEDVATGSLIANRNQIKRWLLGDSEYVMESLW